jgi:hypothetical protein
MAISKNTENSNYFNLNISGIGTVKYIREVPVKNGKNFLACQITALQGKNDDIQYTHFDCCILGNQAEGCLKKLQKADNEKRKILIGFKLGNLHADVFTHIQGTKKGETGVSLKANLVFVSWVKVDGQTVYKAPPADKKQGQEPYKGHPLAA